MGLEFIEGNEAMARGFKGPDKPSPALEALAALLARGTDAETREPARVIAAARPAA